MWFVEDVAAACAIAVASELPPINGSCTTSAVVLLLCALAHLAYLLAVRPFQRRLDATFAVTWAVTVVLVGLCAVVLTRDSGNEGASVALGWLIVVHSLSFFIQPGIAMCWAAILWHRRRAAPRRTDSSEATTTDAPNDVGAPLLAGVPTLHDAGKEGSGAASSTPAAEPAVAVRNPLANA
uniref:Uncharacterized protein n=1 Tax=Neobodo designis TaxID=312471 RepID=A0A7S1LZ73_NEODS